MKADLPAIQSPRKKPHDAGCERRPHATQNQDRHLYPVWRNEAWLEQALHYTLALVQAGTSKIRPSRRNRGGGCYSGAWFSRAQRICCVGPYVFTFSSAGERYAGNG